MILFNYCVFSACITIYAVSKARKEHLIKEASGRPVSNADNIDLSDKNLKMLMLGAFGAGLVNSVGLGGGVIFNPLLIGMGMCP